MWGAGGRWAAKLPLDPPQSITRPAQHPPLGFSPPGLIVPHGPAPQGWEKRRALFPNTIPTPVKKVQGRGAEKNTEIKPSW